MLKKIWLYWYKILVWIPTKIFIVCYLVVKFRMVKEKGSDKFGKPPSIVVANHGTFFDPWLVFLYLHSPRFFIMMNEDGFKTNPFVKWYLGVIGAFPKKKGASDYTAMKFTLKKLLEGYSILIFPEGQTTWDGETQPLFNGIEKILRRANVKLVMVNVRGNFLSKPWWAKTFRTGKVHVRVKTLLPATIKTMSDEDILSTMKEWLYRNDIKDPINQKIRFTGKNLTGGLERFVWMCRNCQTEDTLVTQNDTISCTTCGQSWMMDGNCRLAPVNPQDVAIGDLWDWAAWHKTMVRQRISAAGAEGFLTQSNNVQWCTIDDFGHFTILSTGQLSLTKNKIRFIPVGADKAVVELPVTEINDYVFQRKDVFECRSKDASYLFLFEKHSPMKWVFYFRYLNGFEECEKRGYLL